MTNTGDPPKKPHVALNPQTRKHHIDHDEIHPEDPPRQFNIEKTRVGCGAAPNVHLLLVDPHINYHGCL